MCEHTLVLKSVTRFRGCSPLRTLCQAEKEMIGHIFLLRLLKQLMRNTCGGDIGSFFFTLEMMHFDYLSGKFLLNPGMTTINVLCSCNAFDWAAHLFCT